MTHFQQRLHTLVRFGLNSTNASRLVEFYEQAFGARAKICERQSEQDFANWRHVRGGAERTLLCLGDATLELLEFDRPGRPYPPELPPYDTRFQHFGIVVSDMQRAMERLTQTLGWIAISLEGPQTLPQSAGGVIAFKFRDPDGHPLEFLQFPAGKSPLHWQADRTDGIFRGIDHSAMSVLAIERSMDFYRSLGLQISGRTVNNGPEQERLDGVLDPFMDVIALAPPIPTPHVELLHYRTLSRPAPEQLACTDMAAARLSFVLRADEDTHHARGKLIQDPDGHCLEILGEGPVS